MAGSNDVKAKRATPTPTTKAKMPANKIAALLFRSNKRVNPYIFQVLKNAYARWWKRNRQDSNVKDSVNSKQLIIGYNSYKLNC
tara:strand:- start:485 stop:736 length:252 start_codon:yes stop_codon:yes gene_type:complete